MLKIKLIMSALYLSIIGYYGSSLGTLPKIMGIWIGILTTSMPSILNSLIQIILLLFILWTAIFKPYFQSEKTLFILSLIILGMNALLHIMVLPQTPSGVIIYSLITVLLFFISLGYYGYKVFRHS